MPSQWRRDILRFGPPGAFQNAEIFGVVPPNSAFAATVHWRQSIESKPVKIVWWMLPLAPLILTRCLVCIAKLVLVQSRWCSG